MSPTLRIVAALLVALSAGAVTPVAAQETTPSFVVALDDDGSAAVTLTLTYDLTDQEETDAFEQLQNDSDARAAARSDYRARMAAVANDSENAADRNMSIEDASIDLHTEGDGSLGVVELSVSWIGLAAVDGDRLTVTEPFASGFEPDRQFTIRAPDDYAVETAMPEPSSGTQNSITYQAGVDLSGFQASFGPIRTGGDTPTERTTPGGTSQPGFGLIVAGTAIALAALLARRN